MRYVQHGSALDRVVKTQRQLQSQATAARNQRTSITAGATTIKDADGTTELVTLGVLNNGGRGIGVGQDGAIAIASGGSIYARDAQGRLVLVLGALAGPTKPQDGVAFLADYDGQKYVAFALADYGNDDGPVRSVLAQYDHNGRNAVSTDIGSPLGGLAAPHLPGTSLRDTNITTWPQTTNTDWTTVADGFFEVQNPRITWQIQAYSAEGGALRMLMGGQQIGPEFAVDSSFSTWSDNFDYPSNVEMGGTYLMQLQARVTAAAGTVFAQDKRIQGQQSPSTFTA